MIYRITGFLLLIETAMLLCCGGVSLLYHEDDLISFLQSASLTALMGVVLLFIGRGAEKQLGRRDGYVIVTVAWLAFSLFGMLPFYLSGYIPSITNAFFETMSGFSSTGATILNDIEKLPHGLLFWRSMTQWIGGLGIVFFTIAVLPIFGVGGIQVFAAEASGPTHDKVHPRIGITAKWIWGIYAGLTGTLIILLMFGGMNIFDSICHAFATTSTGGFSTKQASIEYYHSPYIEYVISIFMFISGINFTLLLLFVNGKLKKFVHDAELKWYFWSVTGFTIVIAAILYYNSSMGVEEAFRKSLFQVASLHTSTGFATADYMTWPAITWGMLTVIMIMGACAGSTTGGIKHPSGYTGQSFKKRIQTHHTSQRRASGTGKQTGYLSLHTFYRVSIHFLVYRTNYRRHIGNARVRSRPDGIIGMYHLQSGKHGTRTRPVWSCLLMERTARCC